LTTPLIVRPPLRSPSPSPASTSDFRVHARSSRIQGTPPSCPPYHHERRLHLVEKSATAPSSSSESQCKLMLAGMSSSSLVVDL
jgi:hypothetical protein